MKKLSAQEIRLTWLNFFQAKGHKIEPGSSLVPHNDPTLLWINSGVAALKKYFDGSEIPPSRRITNVQRSIRTNDIENVGHTARHHTFFEMLGNFSIGDYFRKEAISYAFEILTSEKYFAMPLDKLYFTYHPSDQETHHYWLEKGVQEDHLIPLEHNFWEIGEGPCGPNTEVFFDRGEKYDPSNLGVKLLQDELENDRYIEIWGIVFSQYNAVSGVERKNYKELPSKNIDTGAGLERIACILQNTETNFETDLFWPIIQKVEEISNHKYSDNTLAFRVIADHIRACVFALADGETFSNEGRGYVLRRLLRRAKRYGNLLGINHLFLEDLVTVVIDIMKDFYPYLVSKKDFITKMIHAEEAKFTQTLANGEALLRKIVKEQGQLSGKEMFKLYDTFGFPKELTMEICDELHVTYDLDAFNKEMDAQKERARLARNDLQSMSQQSKDLLAFTSVSNFTYGFNDIDSEVIGLFNQGVKVDEISEEGEVIIKDTIFYAEMGGQITDIGEIYNSNFMAKVTKVNKAPNGQHLHHLQVLYGSLKEGDKITLHIDQERRRRIMRNHSATHLLQAALDEVLGTQVHQHGSYVSDEMLHFDFNHYQKLTTEEIQKVEDLVNTWISQAIPNQTEVLPIEEAKKKGAKALFNDKYGDIVRVVCFGDVSKEFCGGTHVFNTEDIGCFVIESEESIAAGIRRIQARTSLGAMELLRKKDTLLHQIAKQVNAQSVSESYPRLKNLIEEKDTLKKEVETLRNKLSLAMSDNLIQKVEPFDNVNLLVTYLSGENRDGLVALSDAIKQKVNDYLLIFIGSSNGSIPLLVRASEKAIQQGYQAGMIVKKLSQYLDGSGGGRPDMASGAGKAMDKIPSLIKNIKELLK